MNKKRIGLLFGSVNSEHDISVASAASALAHFPHDRYECVPIYISKDGKWNVGDFTPEELENMTFTNCQELALTFNLDKPGFMNLVTQEPVLLDGALLVLHGQMGEGGHVQGLLHCANIPFTGSDVLGSSLCMDKAFTHAVCESNGIKMAQYQTIHNITELDMAHVNYPCIVKPTREGSSFGVTYVEDEEGLYKACEFAFQYDSKILVEEYIDGVEVGLSILKTKNEFIISDVDQVNVTGAVFDFQEKYHPHATETLRVSTYPKTLRDAIRNQGAIIFDLLDCRHIARLDFFVTKDDQFYLNEVNTMPGFTKNSRYPMMLQNVGVEYTELMAKMVEDIL